MGHYFLDTQYNYLQETNKLQKKYSYLLAHFF